MRFYTKCTLLIVAVLSSMILVQCQIPFLQTQPVNEGTGIEPMVIERIESFGDITEDMWNETYNTFLVLKIHRLIQYEGPDQISTLEITAEIPLYAQRSATSAAVYGRGESEASLQAEISGVGTSEASWGLNYEVLGYINPAPDCGLELKVDEEWLEGTMCTTVLGLTNCEADEGGQYQWAYGIVEFPFIVGEASNLENLNFEVGGSTLETFIEIIPTGEQVVNLPDVSGCDFEDIED